MAQGRMLKQNITQSKKFLALQSNDHRMIYMLILPFVDREGRINAEPLYLKAHIFRRMDVTQQQIHDALKDLERVNLIRLYADEDNEAILEITDFLKHNSPNAREAASTFPSPDDADARPTTLFSTNETPPTDNARTMHGPRTDKEHAEGKGEGKGEGEGEGTRAHAPMPASREATRATTTPKKQSQRKPAPARLAGCSTVEILQAKFGEIYADLLEEAPERAEAWLKLPPDRVLDLAKQASGPGRKFRTTFKRLLDLSSGLIGLDGEADEPRRKPWDVSGGDRQNRNHPDWRPVRGQKVEAQPQRRDPDEKIRANEHAGQDRRAHLTQQANKLLGLN